MENNFSDTVKSLKFTTVYWVDDEHAKDTDVGLPGLITLLVDRIAILDSKKVSALISAFDEVARPPLQVLAKDWDKHEKNLKADKDSDFDTVLSCESAIKKAIELQADNAIAKVQNALAALPGALSSRQKEIMATIFSQLPETVELKPISFSDWARDKSNILLKHDSTNTALFLLDQQNVVEVGAPDGKSVVADIIGAAKEKIDTFHILMVTSLCEKDGEHKHATKFLNELNENNSTDGNERMNGLAQVSLDVPLFAMSKSRLNKIDVADLEAAKLEFEHLLVDYFVRIKLSNLSKQFAVETKEHLKSAVEEAYKKLRRMSLEEFMYAVAGSPRSEGVSELDALVRMLAVEQRRALTEQIVNHDSVRKLLGEMRGLSIPFDSLKDLASGEGLIALRHSEAFEPAISLNSLLQPITSGDIFTCSLTRKIDEETIVENRDFVLVSNACDLMLRGDTGKRKLAHQAILLPLIKSKSSDDVFKLPCPLTNDSNGAVWFSDIYTVPLEVLDLCSYRSDGKAIWEKGAYAKLGRNLLESQIKRAKEIESILSEGTICNIVKKSSAMMAISIKPGEDKKAISANFSIQRISRLTPPIAGELVHKFSVFMGRPALDYDYSTNRTSVEPSAIE
ncbi:hypothetical protein J2X54_000195 [Duganella sp. 3397]|uniref:hypothetical protein n=1 Tax=Duganella sp. 3397 TaxID=2817732 RepID=UPI00285461B1|nr:hypothetical protein [Duganella sp. 3397]MDR7047760.1 hypothetical protein [Duganella sp. 3397]